MTRVTPLSSSNGNAPPPPETGPGPINAVLRFFSSVRLGIVLLVVLFFYSWIGSAGIFYPTSILIFDQPWAHSMPRQWRAFELTEFEWFHTWFFDLNIALIVVNITVTTLRRIPLTVLSLGVWNIHAGIVILCLGSVIYFGTKVEGDAPVIRRNVVLTTASGERTIPALMGNRIGFTDGQRQRYEMTISRIEPERHTDGNDAFAVVLDGIGPTGPFTVDLVDGQGGRAFSREILVTLGDESTTVQAREGATGAIGGDDGYQIAVASIQPSWTLLSGPDAGRGAYAIEISIRRLQDDFIFGRQLLDGYPEFTEDIVGGRRSINVPEYGTRTIDDTISATIRRVPVPSPFRLTLSPSPQQYFWEKDSSALKVREIPAGGDRAEIDWWSYPIRNLPRYNDYFGRLEDVWPLNSETPGPLSIGFTSSELERGPMQYIDDIRITGYLRYAILDERQVGDGALLNPYARLRIQDQTGQFQDAELFAFDPARRQVSGVMQFDWIADIARLERYEQPWRTRRLSLRVPDRDIELDVVIDESTLTRDAPFLDIEGSDVRWRATRLFDDLSMPDGGILSVLVVEVEIDGRTIKRWVANEPMRSRDIAGGDGGDHQMMPPDPIVSMTYDPGIAGRVVLVAGPGEIGTRLVFYGADGMPTIREVTEGDQLELDNGISVTLADFETNSQLESRPAIVPEPQRVRNVDLGRYQQWVQVEVRDGDRVHREWLAFHRYSHRHVSESMPGHGAFRPTEIKLRDGRTIELMFSRERLAMKHPVILDDFHMIAHTGGYTGQTNTIRDWESHVRFLTEEGPSDIRVVRSNGPAAWKGLWFFQSFWDPPEHESDVPLDGLSYTGLGIGNRRGVYIQLFGCCLSVAGMLYAFYVKPVIRRRRKERVYAEVEAAKLAAAGSSADEEVAS